MSNEKYNLKLVLNIENKNHERNELDLLLTLRNHLNKELNDLGITIEEFNLEREEK